MYFLEVCCAYQQSIQSLWNFSLGVKTMQLSSDRRPVLGVPSYTYGSTHHITARSQDPSTCWIWCETKILWRANGTPAPYPSEQGRCCASWAITCSINVWLYHVFQLLQCISTDVITRGRLGRCIAVRVGEVISLLQKAGMNNPSIIKETVATDMLRNDNCRRSQQKFLDHRSTSWCIAVCRWKFVHWAVHHHQSDVDSMLWKCAYMLATILSLHLAWFEWWSWM